MLPTIGHGIVFMAYIAEPAAKFNRSQGSTRTAKFSKISYASTDHRTVSTSVNITG